MRENWLVVGLGLSGYWGARLVLERENPFSLTVCEGSPTPEKEAKARELRVICENKGCHFEVIWAPEPKGWEGIDKIVISPGVPYNLPWLKEVREVGVEVMGEMELAFRHTKAPVIAITGTNGKTTTTALLAHILNSAGIKAWAGGNIGDPLAHFVLSKEERDWIVLEVSSFQLEAISRFHPKVAMLLNIEEDHLDRYPSMAEYAEAKGNILLNTEPHDRIVANSDDPLVMEMVNKSPAALLTFGCSQTPPLPLMRVEGSRLIFNGEPLKELAELTFQERTNLPNLMAAVLGAYAVGLQPEVALSAIRDFQWQPHRVEVVHKKSGITFVDDSKATNPSAVKHALTALDSPIILLLGGRNKGFRFSPILPVLAKKAKRVLIFGEAAKEIEGDLKRGKAELSVHPSMADAVKEAVKMAQPGDTVLLSPGCASFDEFGSYAERGEAFRALVKEMA